MLCICCSPSLTMLTAVICAKDLDGCYVLVNREYEIQFHLTKAEIIGKTDYAMFHAEQADLLRAHDEQVQTRRPIEWEKVVSVNGGLHTYLSLKFPLCDSAGKRSAEALISTDITARTQNAVVALFRNEIFITSEYLNYLLIKLYSERN